MRFGRYTNYSSRRQQTLQNAVASLRRVGAISLRERLLFVEFGRQWWSTGWLAGSSAVATGGVRVSACRESACACLLGDLPLPRDMLAAPRRLRAASSEQALYAVCSNTFISCLPSVRTVRMYVLSTGG